MAEKHFDTATGTRASGAMWWALVIGVIAAIFLFTGVGASNHRRAAPVDRDPVRALRGFQARLSSPTRQHHKDTKRTKSIVTL